MGVIFAMLFNTLQEILFRRPITSSGREVTGEWFEVGDGPRGETDSEGIA